MPDSQSAVRKAGDERRRSGRSARISTIQLANLFSEIIGGMGRALLVAEIEPG
jgi:hypothetical protein